MAVSKEGRGTCIDLSTSRKASVDYIFHILIDAYIRATACSAYTLIEKYFQKNDDE